MSNTGRHSQAYMKGYEAAKQGKLLSQILSSVGKDTERIQITKGFAQGTIDLRKKKP